LISQSIEKKLGYFLSKPLLAISTIGVISLVLRLNYFPYGVPVGLDGLAYFWYASDISNLSGFPTEYNMGNNGWPIFLSLIFSLFHFDNFLDYMTVQRFTSVFISTLTIIPVYFVCRRFFDKSYSVIGAALFAFEPRIIQNSLLGLTDPAYVLLSAISFALFFNQQRKWVYLSFIVAGLAAFVRSEGIFIFAAFTITFFIIHKKEPKKILYYLGALGLYLATVLPMIFWRIQNNGGDLISGRITQEANNVMAKYSTDQGGPGLINYITHAVWNFIQLGGWSLIPVFILFIPFGTYYLFRQKDMPRIGIITLIIILLIPVFLSFSLANDVRYIFYIYPLFCVVALLALSRAGNKIKNQNIFLILVICGVFLSSTLYLEIKLTDNEYQLEVFDLGKEITKRASGINGYYPQSMYLESASIPDKWPILKSSLKSNIHVFDTENYQTVRQFIEMNRGEGLSHIVADDFEKRPEFLRNVYFHDENYPYLKKVFDSQQAGYTRYHVKIYEIDYSVFDWIDKQ
jgi:hypothetical protein